MDLQTLITRVQEAGVVGAGGAGFPTWRKLDCQGRVDTLIVNGAECEPLLYADYHCMIQYADRIVAAAATLRDALGLSRVVVAGKRKRAAVREVFQRYLPEDGGVEWLDLPDVYPSGDEHILVYEATGRIVPQGGIPLEVGVLVQNAQTMIHIHQALEGRPVTRRFISVGGAVATPVTLEAPVGTPLSALLEAAGGPTIPEPFFLAGGAMMGQLVGDSFATAKTTSGILVLPADNPAVMERRTPLDREIRVSASVCDQCYACTELCPRHLIGHEIEPHLLMRRARAIMEDPRERDHIAHYCCECGICSLVACPVRITPRRLIAGFKHRVPGEYRRRRPEYRVHPVYEQKRLPMSYLIRRLALDGYVAGSRFLGELRDLERVRVPLAEFAGHVAEPLVEVGDRVMENELIARGRFSLVHAPVGGVVERVDDAVEISRTF